MIDRISSWTGLSHGYQTSLAYRYLIAILSQRCRSHNLIPSTRHASKLFQSSKHSFNQVQSPPQGEVQRVKPFPSESIIKITQTSTMPTKTPSQSDFPSNLTVTITLPPSTSTSTSTPSPNILLLLHGIGDTAAGFTPFCRALHLPETTIITIQAPAPLPFDLGGFHWGDDVSFDSRTGALDMDAGFTRSTALLANEVIRQTLMQKCGYQLREIMILGFGQGGMAGLSVARELGSAEGQTQAGGALAGVISIGAPYALSGPRAGSKNRSPVLLVAGRDSEVVSDGAVRRTKEVFEFVEVSRYARRGDGMPSNREEMLPVMQFFARRLRSRQGVPEGSFEIG